MLRARLARRKSGNAYGDYCGGKAACMQYGISFRSQTNNWPWPILAVAAKSKFHGLAVLIIYHTQVSMSLQTLRHLFLLMMIRSIIYLPSMFWNISRISSASCKSFTGFFVQPVSSMSLRPTGVMSTPSPTQLIFVLWIYKHSNTSASHVSESYLGNHSS